MAQSKRKVSHLPAAAHQRKPMAVPGRYFDLELIFNRLNARYFRNALRRYRIVWGRRRKQRPREYFIFGSIQEEDRIIRIHPLLDAAFVPRWFMEYVIYHEMLHSVVPDEPLKGGRRRVHTAEFLRRERQFRDYRKARLWEEKNLRRFLR